MPLVAAVALLQSSVAPYFSVGGVTFDLVLIGAVLWGINYGPAYALVWVAVGGVLDVFGGLPWGSSMLALLPAALLTLTARASVVESRVLLTIGVVTTGTLAAGIIRMLIAASLGAPTDVTQVAGFILLPQMLANAFLACLLLPLVGGRSQRRGLPWLAHE